MKISIDTVPVETFPVEVHHERFALTQRRLAEEAIRSAGVFDPTSSETFAGPVAEYHIPEMVSANDQEDFVQAA